MGFDDDGEWAVVVTKFTLFFLQEHVMVMSAWYGEPKLKAAAMARLREDRRLDRITQGVYWDEGRGCHLGCLTRCDDDAHNATVRMFGLPLSIAYLLEAVFEGLPQDRCEWWVIEATDSIPVGADLSLSHHRLMEWLLGPDSPSAHGNMHESVASAVSTCRELHRLAADGKAVSSDQWSAARSAVWSAAESAARSARSAAESAAWSTISAARSVTESTTRSVATTTTRSAAWIKIAEKSIEIFQSSPIVECDSCEEAVAESLIALRSPVMVTP